MQGPYPPPPYRPAPNAGPAPFGPPVAYYGAPISGQQQYHSAHQSSYGPPPDF